MAGVLLAGLGGCAAATDARIVALVLAADPSQSADALRASNQELFDGADSSFLASAPVFGLWRIFGGVTTKVDPYRIAGIATRAEVTRAASHSAIMKRAEHLRPSLAKARPTDVGYRIGRSHNTAIWASVEDSILVIGPPRSGKGAHIVINAILDAPVRS